MVLNTVVIDPLSQWFHGKRRPLCIVLYVRRPLCIVNEVDNTTKSTRLATSAPSNGDAYASFLADVYTESDSLYLSFFSYLASH